MKNSEKNKKIDIPANLIPTHSQVDLLWWTKNTLTTEKGTPLDFINRKYLIDIYDCWHKEIVIKKSAQMGLSNFAIDKALWLATNYDINAIYTMPTSGEVSEFSQTRVNPIILKSKIAVLKDVDNVKVKQIGNSFIYFRGTWDEKQAISTPSDFNIHDEIDKSKPDVIAMFVERLSASMWKWDLKLSTPTVKNFGIDAAFNESDKREWFVKCNKCELEQVLTINHIDTEHNLYRCEKCKASLINTNGRWKPTAKSEIAGFHVTQLMASWIEPKEIIKKQDKYRYKKDFYNFVLAETYEGGSNLITRLDIINSVKSFDATGNVVIGVDWGDISWLVVKQGGNILHLTKIEGDTRTHWKQVAEYMDKFPKCIAICDFGYGDTKNKELIDKFPNQVFMCLYSEDGKFLYPKFDDEKHTVNVDRTRSIEFTLNQIKDGNTKIAQNDQLELFIQHHLNLVETKTEDKHGTIKTTISRSGADHYAHANNYATIPEMKKPKGEIRIRTI